MDNIEFQNNRLVINGKIMNNSKFSKTIFKLALRSKSFGCFTKEDVIKAFYTKRRKRLSEGLKACAIVSARTGISRLRRQLKAETGQNWLLYWNETYYLNEAVLSRHISPNGAATIVIDNKQHII